MTDSAIGGLSRLETPEPDLTPDAMVDRAVRLRPRLRELQEEVELLGHYPEEVHTTFERLGFYRMLQPRRFGGYEFDIPTFFKVIVEVARGCPSTGWCLSLGSGHALVMGSHFPAETQAQAFGPDGHFISPHSANPNVGVAQPAEGGYLISGTWPYASGAPYATHFMGNVFLPPRDDGPRQLSVFVTPRDACEVLDDWHGDRILGMRGSGSNSVRLENVFVPESNLFPFGALFAPAVSETEGTRLHDSPMYLGQVAGFYHGEIVSNIVGAAKAALDEYEEIITTTTTALPPHVLRSEHPDFQREYGEAATLVLAAEALLLKAGEQYMHWCEKAVAGSRPFQQEDDLKVFALIQYAGRTAATAVELMFATANAGAGQAGARMRRYYRDIAIYRGHNSAQYLDTDQRYAKVHFKVPGANPFAS